MGRKWLGVCVSRAVCTATDAPHRGVQTVETNFAVLLSGTPARIRGVPVSNFGPETGYRNCNLLSILPSKFQMGGFLKFGHNRLLPNPYQIFM